MKGVYQWCAEKICTGELPSSTCAILAVRRLGATTRIEPMLC